MSLVFSKSRQPQIIMTVFCQRLPITCLLGCVSLWLFWLSPRICLGQFKAEKTCSIPPSSISALHWIFSLVRFLVSFLPSTSWLFFAEKDRIQVPIKILQFSFDRKKEDVFHICQRCVFSTFNCHSRCQTSFLFMSLKSHSSSSQKGGFH